MVKHSPQIIASEEKAPPPLPVSRQCMMALEYLNKVVGVITEKMVLLGIKHTRQSQNRLLSLPPEWADYAVQVQCWNRSLTPAHKPQLVRERSSTVASAR